MALAATPLVFWKRGWMPAPWPPLPAPTPCVCLSMTTWTARCCRACTPWVCAWWCCAVLALTRWTWQPHKSLALPCAGCRVPEYSPHAVAEHTLALLLTLNRKIHRAYARVREGNFALDGLLGFDVHGRTVGVVGTGRIGETFCRLMTGFGCTLLAADPIPNPACVAMGVQYVPLPELLARSDVVSLHCPLTPHTHHLINAAAFASMKRGAMLLNTSRGAVVDTQAAIAALKAGTLGSLGLDVYEEEGGLFFRDLSGAGIQDDVFARLLTFPNVVVTGHQGFFTEDALAAIACTTLGNLDAFAATGKPMFPVPT